MVIMMIKKDASRVGDGYDALRTVASRPFGNPVKNTIKFDVFEKILAGGELKRSTVYDILSRDGFSKEDVLENMNFYSGKGQLWGGEHTVRLEKEPKPPVDVDANTQRIAKVMVEFLTGTCEWHPDFMPTLAIMERAVRKVQQEFYTENVDVETLKRISEKNAELAQEIARLKGLLAQQEADFARYDRFLGTVRDALTEVEAE